MKRFFCKCAVLFVLLCGVVFVLNFLYMRTNRGKWLYDVTRFQHVPEQIELANVGSSHGLYSFYWNFVPELNAFNFATTGQKYFFDLAVLRQYALHIKENAIVLIPISYHGVTDRDEDLSTPARYYPFLKREYMRSWSFLDWLRFAKFPVLSAKFYLFCLIKDDPDGDPLLRWDTVMTDEKIKKDSFRIFSDWTSEGRDRGLDGYKENIREVSAIIDFCRERKFRPVLITTPFPDTLNDLYENHGNFFETFYRFSSELCEKYDIPYLDYSHDADFSPNHELFYDGHHLNVYGAEKFTRRVVRDLQKMDLIKGNDSEP